MDISIVIVNYNVQHFLEQCLQSVQKATQGIAAEVFVVDNASKDGSCDMVRKKFPEVHLIANKDNVGFARANNQAMAISKGRYILLLNPDTVVQPDTFSKCINFMDAHADAGGLGVKMIDGKGIFLPESKRGLPTPMVAFYKIFGLSALFSKSKLFGKYHLSYLSNTENHEVDVLSGAFMLMRKATLDKCGLLDETFFMYGEDIDLSYRITLAGYKNYYFADTQIIHYKGESTKKSSVNYVFVFYRAMAIFAAKHFSKQNAKLFNLLINIAIYLRAGIAITYRFFTKISLPLIDASIMYGGMYLLKNYWEHNHRYVKIAYPPEFMEIMVPAYIALWLLGIIFSGGYSKPIRIGRIVSGLFSGALAIAVLYAFLPDTWRFSRALIILGSFWGVIGLISFRLIMNTLGLKNFKLDGSTTEKRTVLVGSEEECHRMEKLMKNTGLPQAVVGFIHPQDTDSENSTYIGSITQLPELINIFKINEIIFSAKSVAANDIMTTMADLSSRNPEFKIAPEDSQFIIGSNSIHQKGNWYSEDISFNINKPTQQRYKRLFDVSLAVLLLIASPISYFIVNQKEAFFSNCIAIIFGTKTWVAYAPTVSLPKLLPGVWQPADMHNKTFSTQDIFRINLWYAKDYQVGNDWEVVWKKLF